LNGPAARELDAAWSAEIEERLAEYDSGAVAAIEAEEVFTAAMGSAAAMGSGRKHKPPTRITDRTHRFIQAAIHGSVHCAPWPKQRSAICGN
jgi:hypothetical protein